MSGIADPELSDPSSPESDSEIQRQREQLNERRNNLSKEEKVSRSVSTDRSQKVMDPLKIIKNARKAIKDAKEADKPAAMKQLKDDIKEDYDYYLKSNGNNQELARLSLWEDYKTQQQFWDPTKDGEFDPSKRDRRKGVDWPRNDLGKKLILNKDIRDDIGDQMSKWLDNKYQKTAIEYSMEKKRAEKGNKSSKDQQKEDSKLWKEIEKSVFEGWYTNNDLPNFRVGDYVVSRDITQAKLKGKQGKVMGISKCNNVFEMLNGSGKLTLQFVSRFTRDRTRSRRSGPRRESTKKPMEMSTGLGPREESKATDVEMSTGLGPREESKATDVEMSTGLGLAR
jgi:hypothetical protein